MQVEEEIETLQQACETLTRTQTQLASWYGPAGYKLMHARAYLENSYLNPLVEQLLAAPEEEQIGGAA